MNTKWKLGILGITLIIASTSLVAAYAATPTPPTQGEIYNKIIAVYNYLVNTVNTKLDTLLNRMTADRADNLDRVSTELGMLTGTYWSHDINLVPIVTAGVMPDLARFTITVSFYQGDVDDAITVMMSQDGITWNQVFVLQPGAGAYETQSTTVVCKRIMIQAYNVNTDYPGADPGSSVAAWAISAVGSPDSPSLTVYP